MSLIKQKIKNLIEIIITVLSVGIVFTEEVETPYFSLTIPDGLVVKSSDNKILMFGKNGPYKKYHFMAIEFGNELDVGKLVKSIKNW